MKSTCIILLTMILVVILVGCSSEDIPAGYPKIPTQPSCRVTIVTLDPYSVTVAPGATVQYTFEVEGDGDVPQDVKWKIEGGNRNSIISEDGLLEVSITEVIPTNLKITVTSVADYRKSADAYVYVR